MRTHFELKYGSDTLDQARATAYEKIAEFMEVTEVAVPALVDIELKVGIPDPEKDSDVTNRFIVTVYGNIKNSVAKPF
jgi:hypothetical protein